MRDLTVSAWNRFHSFPLIEGLTIGGFDVLALGTSRRRPHCAEYVCCWSSALLTQASYHVGFLQHFLTEAALGRYEKFATNHALDTRCFWGWSNHHRSAFEKARAAGIPVILEAGSTHARWADRTLRRVYANGNENSHHLISPKRMSNMLAEYELADAISVPSSFVARTFVQEGISTEKIHVNPYGVDTELWGRAVANRKDRKNRPFTFVYCGQIMKRKGFHYLLEAWRTANLNTAELWLIGGVEIACRNLMTNLPRGVKHLGWKSHADVRTLYAEADVYVLPSLEEGLARSILEAMAAGLPVIITEATGATDIMVDREDGWVVRPGDPVSLADALGDAAKDPESTRRRGTSAAARVQPFTWSAYGVRAAAFLKSFLEKR